jgi:putative component of membrane protein insertase Oxa1/YidC/SpoIIIJ protein YidD
MMSAGDQLIRSRNEAYTVTQSTYDVYMRNLLHHSASLMASHIVMLPRNLIVGIITGYQHTLSPDHGPLRHLYPYGYCRHSPTCSVYAKDVIGKRGVVIGIPMSVWRVLKCNPFAKPSEERIREILLRG